MSAQSEADTCQAKLKMVSEPVHSPTRALAVLHPVFALTGVLHAAVGSLVPSVTLRFQLGDRDSGLLFLLYYGGTSIGALMSRRNYLRTITLGFLGVVGSCMLVVESSRALLPISFLLLGISVGVPMSAVSLFVGRAFPERCAPILTFLNFSWSIGALAAPLIAARILMQHTYRAAYLFFAALAMVAALACSLFLKERRSEERTVSSGSGYLRVGLILIFALAAFLEVGIENTAAAWLPTYLLRSAEKGIALAAASSSFYWVGFLVSRGLCSLVLVRVAPIHVFRVAIAMGMVAALLLATVTSATGRGVSIFILGAALAPNYPLVVAGSLARVQRSSDSRWVMATAGFGGSVLPWLAGAISAHAGSLRMGMLVIPAALIVMLTLIPAFRGIKQPAAQTENCGANEKTSNPLH